MIICLNVSKLDCSFDVCIVFLWRIKSCCTDNERSVDHCKTSIDATFIVMTGFGAHKRAQHFVTDNFPIQTYSLFVAVQVFCKDARKVSKLTQTEMTRNLSIPQHQSRNHGRVNPFHDQVGAECPVQTIGSLCSHEILSDLLIKEVVATTLFLRLEHKLMRIQQRSLHYLVDRGAVFAKIFQTPNALEKGSKNLCGLVRARDLPQQGFVRKALLKLFESG